MSLYSLCDIVGVSINVLDSNNLLNVSQAVKEQICKFQLEWPYFLFGVGWPQSWSDEVWHIFFFFYMDIIYYLCMYICFFSV